jgi:hypothetical protein
MRAAVGRAALTLNENASSAVNRSKTTASGLARSSASSKSPPRLGETRCAVIPAFSKDSVCSFARAHAR